MTITSYSENTGSHISFKNFYFTLMREVGGEEAEAEKEMNTKSTAQHWLMLVLGTEPCHALEFQA